MVPRLLHDSVGPVEMPQQRGRRLVFEWEDGEQHPDSSYVRYENPTSPPIFGVWLVWKGSNSLRGKFWRMGNASSNANPKILNLDRGWSVNTADAPSPTT